MAQTIPCDLCNQVAADFIISFPNGDTPVGVGIECFADWALPIIEAYNEAVEREQGLANLDIDNPELGDKAFEASARPKRGKQEDPPETVEVEQGEPEAVTSAPADVAE